jgi:cell division protein FtsL
MEQQLLIEMQRLRRSLRTIKLLLGFFFLVFIALLAVLGFIAYKVVTFTHDVNNRITKFENTTSQNLDVKQQICSNKSLTGLLGSNNDLCK